MPHVTGSARPGPFNGTGGNASETAQVGAAGSSQSLSHRLNIQVVAGTCQIQIQIQRRRLRATDGDSRRAHLETFHAAGVAGWWAGSRALA